jgi:hypothetical protein
MVWTNGQEEDFSHIHPVTITQAPTPLLLMGTRDSFHGGKMARVKR